MRALWAVPVGALVQTAVDSEALVTRTQSVDSAGSGRFSDFWVEDVLHTVNAGLMECCCKWGPCSAKYDQGLSSTHFYQRSEGVCCKHVRRGSCQWSFLNPFPAYKLKRPDRDHNGHHRYCTPRPTCSQSHEKVAEFN